MNFFEYFWMWKVYYESADYACLRATHRQADGGELRIENWELGMMRDEWGWGSGSGFLEKDRLLNLFVLFACLSKPRRRQVVPNQKRKNYPPN
ncbi:MAG: hypothetical protein B0D92_03130 [Spirochaeta sp. LUC14_002_19_P3]|nr:MAG: hypothetical protein B0D92_03130 [Spirochaeta sp. LUC14_002_19_P3]